MNSPTNSTAYENMIAGRKQAARLNAILKAGFTMPNGFVLTREHILGIIPVTYDTHEPLQPVTTPVMDSETLRPLWRDDIRQYCAGIEEMQNNIKELAARINAVSAKVDAVPQAQYQVAMPPTYPTTAQSYQSYPTRTPSPRVTLSDGTSVTEKHFNFAATTVSKRFQIPLEEISDPSVWWSDGVTPANKEGKTFEILWIEYNNGDTTKKYPSSNDEPVFVTGLDTTTSQV